MIEACRLLRERGVEFRCEIIGEGPLESALRDADHASGLDGYWSLAGPLAQSEVVEHLARATVFALPCVTEAGGGMDNLPTVLMEAMAACLPVVSTRIGGVPEMVLDGLTGLLVAEHQPAALAEADRAYSGRSTLAKSLGEAGRQRAADLFVSRNASERCTLSYDHLAPRDPTESQCPAMQDLF